MGQTNILTKEAFEQDKTLKSKFGSYENYTTSFQQGGATENNSGTTPQNSEQPTTTPTGNNPDYTMNDVASVAETGSLPPTEPMSAYDMYMEEARNIYNQGVEANNKNAANQAASAGAQYREMNRNVGELNKANGKADTGYAGDTSIDAYNAYRNSVNKSYSDANSANNDLYSYYLSEMTKLQQAKDTKEATDRQLEQTDRQLTQQEEEFEFTKTQQVLDTIAGYVDESSYLENGNITSEAAKEMWDYAVSYYNGAENIPNEVVASLKSEPGFSEWLAEYNATGGNVVEYDKVNTVDWSETQKIDENGNVSKDGIEFKVLNSTNSKGSRWRDKKGDNFKLTVDGKTWKVEMHESADSNTATIVKNIIAKGKKRTAQPGDACVYGDRIYVICENGAVREVRQRTNSHISMSDLIEKLK